MVVDDFSRYSFMSFFRGKSKTTEHLKSLFNRIRVEISYPIIRIKSDKGERGEREFDNMDVYLF